tara:strand:- start:1899 stop:3680 length:1782 start_codon:yes stop_codon:yes gene_type:complete
MDVELGLLKLSIEPFGVKCAKVKKICNHIFSAYAARILCSDGTTKRVWGYYSAHAFIRNFFDCFGCVLIKCNSKNDLDIEITKECNTWIDQLSVYLKMISIIEIGNSDNITLSSAEMEKLNTIFCCGYGKQIFLKCTKEQFSDAYIVYFLMVCLRKYLDNNANEIYKNSLVCSSDDNWCLISWLYDNYFFANKMPYTSGVPNKIYQDFKKRYPELTRTEAEELRLFLTKKFSIFVAEYHNSIQTSKQLNILSWRVEVSKYDMINTYGIIPYTDIKNIPFDPDIEYLKTLKWFPFEYYEKEIRDLASKNSNKIFEDTTFNTTQLLPKNIDNNEEGTNHDEDKDENEDEDEDYEGDEEDYEGDEEDYEGDGEDNTDHGGDEDEDDGEDDKDTKDNTKEKLAKKKKSKKKENVEKINYSGKKWKIVLDNWINGTCLPLPQFNNLNNEINAFIWRTTPINRNEDQTFDEEVLFDENLPNEQDPKSFREYLSKMKPSDHVISFNSHSNLIKNTKTTLVIPNVRPGKNFATLAHFIKNADEAQQKALWEKVGKVARKMLKRYPQVWISTHGHSVPYLHIRISNSDDYYYSNKKTTLTWT